MRFILPCLLLLVATASGCQTFSGTTSAGIATQPPTIFFAPPAGTYATTQSVRISPSIAASSVFYTIDGAPATEASLLYSSALTVSSNETLHATAITPAPTIEAQQLQQCSSNSCWKTQTAATSTQAAPYIANWNTPSFAYCPSSGSSGGCGVQGIPTAINYITGISSPSLSGNATHLNFTTQNVSGAGSETQVLWANVQSGADSATYQVEDFAEQPDENFSDMQAVESDLVDWNTTRTLILSGALQCNLLGESPAQWQYNGQVGGWHNFGFNYAGSAMTVFKNGVSIGSGSSGAITEGCGSSMSGNWTHVQYHVSFNPNVLSCTDATTLNPQECIYIDYLTINGDKYTFGTTSGLDQHGTPIVVSLLSVPATALPNGYPDRCFNQIQIDGRGTGASSGNPVTYGFYYDNMGMSCGGGLPNASGSAAYTIP